MRPRAELALAAAILLALGFGAAALGSRHARDTGADLRRSTYLRGPDGASGFTGALARLGVRVVRHRRGVISLDSVARLDGRTVVALLGPSWPLSPFEAARVAGFSADLLLAGDGAESVMWCLGYEVRLPRADTVGALGGEGSNWGARPTVHRVLAPRSDSAGAPPSVPSDRRAACTTPARLAVDTLLRTVRGRPVALRLALPGGRQATLVADDGLFANRALRETAAGPFALTLVLPRYDRIVVDEYHQGFDASGSLAGASLAWSLRSPWGWAAWQLTLVGVLALFAAGVRFGPVLAGIERRRRSPLEHVRALATALAAARGHDVAVRLMVQGLRRRLGRSGREAHGEPESWLLALAPSMRTERGRAALAALTDIARRPAGSDEVLRAADAVETLWEELRPA